MTLDKEELKKEYLNNKLSTHQIARKHGLKNNQRIYLLLKKFQIQIRNPKECKLASLNPMWKGDKVSYYSIHEWIANRKPKPKLCEKCKKKPPYDLANISGKYKRDINDFKWLCRKCHMIEDGSYIIAINNLKNAYRIRGNNDRYIKNL